MSSEKAHLLCSIIQNTFNIMRSNFQSVRYCTKFGIRIKFELIRLYLFNDDVLSYKEYRILHYNHGTYGISQNISENMEIARFLVDEINKVN